MQRDIIKIDEEKCNGCGLCVPNCHEGALQVIDGKVRLVSELMCDGLGACIGHCPEGAITIEKREAEPYDEITVISGMVSKGANTVKAHLKHLKDHHEYGYLEEGTTWLEVHSKDLSFSAEEVLDAVSGKSGQGNADPGTPAEHGENGAHGTNNANRGHGGHEGHRHGAHGANGGHGGMVHTVQTADTEDKVGTVGTVGTVMAVAAARAAGRE